jgi:hypothetical protein
MNGDSLTKPVTPYSYRHPQLIARVRVGVGVWLLILTAILCGSRHVGWWGALLLPAAALHFYLAYRLPGATSPGTNSRDAT